MTAYRVGYLYLIGFVWDASHARWNDKLKELKEYWKNYGDCSVLCGYEGNPQLGRYVSDQQQEYRKMKKGKQSQMTEDRVRKLEAVGFEWKGKRGLRW